MIKHLLSKTVLCTCILLTPVLATRLHACTGHDIIFTKITFTSISTGEYVYTYQIKNIGTAAIPINDLVIQNYVSKDNIDGADAAAGGSYIDIQSTASIAAGATYTGTMSASPFPANPISTYPYIIIDIYFNSETECDITNNQYIGLIQTTTTSTRSSQLSDASVNWNNDTKSFSVSKWSGTTKPLHYTIVTASGEAVLSGTTTEEENTPLYGLKEGMYIIYLSDEEKVYSKKIIY